jgi:hypothetical protein
VEGTGPETFGAVARTWLKRHVAKNGLRSRDEIERVLAKYIMPKWAGRDFTSIKRGDVAGLMDLIEDKHGPRQADYCLAVISGICNWFVYHFWKLTNWKKGDSDQGHRGEMKDIAASYVIEIFLEHLPIANDDQLFIFWEWIRSRMERPGRLTLSGPKGIVRPLLDNTLGHNPPK